MLGQPHIEVHLNGSVDFTRKRYSEAVRELDGSYSYCRGDTDKRFVKIPATREGWDLIDTLIAEFGESRNSQDKTVAIARNYGDGDGCGIVFYVRRGKRVRDEFARALIMRRRNGAPAATPLVARVRAERAAVRALGAYLGRLERTYSERQAWAERCLREAEKWERRAARWSFVGSNKQCLRVNAATKSTL